MHVSTRMYRKSGGPGKIKIRFEPAKWRVLWLSGTKTKLDFLLDCYFPINRLRSKRRILPIITLFYWVSSKWSSENCCPQIHFCPILSFLPTIIHHSSTLLTITQSYLHLSTFIHLYLLSSTCIAAIHQEQFLSIRINFYQKLSNLTKLYLMLPTVIQLYLLLSTLIHHALSSCPLLLYLLIKFYQLLSTLIKCFQTLSVDSLS